MQIGAQEVPSEYREHFCVVQMAEQQHGLPRGCGVSLQIFRSCLDLMLGTLLCVPPGAGVRSDCPRGPCQPLLILWCVVCDSVVTQVSAWKVVFAALEIFLPMQLERIIPSFCLI